MQVALLALPGQAKLQFQVVNAPGEAGPAMWEQARQAEEAARAGQAQVTVPLSQARDRSWQPSARALAGRRAGARGGALTQVDVEEFVVPLEPVDETLEPLQQAGRHSYEAFVLWGGRFAGDGRRFEFISAYFPEQTTSRGEEGLRVTVEVRRSSGSTAPSTGAR